MPRPPEPQRKVETLAAATDWVLGHGLSGLSLRPLAAALGTSPRMLLYDFGTREALLTDILAEARRRQVASLAVALDRPCATDDDVTAQNAAAQDAHALQSAWGWFTDHLPYVRLLFEVYLDSLSRPDAYAGRRELVDDWIGYMTAAFGIDATRATLVLAVLRGLALDRLSAPDPQLTDDALTLFARLLLDGS